MPGFGYSDWIRESTNFSYAIIDDHFVMTMTGKSYGQIYVGNWPYIRIGFENDDLLAADFINVTWTDDQAGLIPGGLNQIVFGPGDKSGTTLPVLAPFMNVAIASNVNASRSTRLLVYGTASDGRQSLNSDLVHYEMMRNSSAYAANTTQTFTSNFWYTGWAQVSMTSNLGGAALVRLEYLDSTLTAHNFGYVAALAQSAADMEQVFIPPYILEAVVINGTTAQQLELIISPAPR